MIKTQLKKKYSDIDKKNIIKEVELAGGRVAGVASKHKINASILYGWIKNMEGKKKRRNYRRSFSKKERADAVALVINDGVQCKDVSEQLGIHMSTIRRWVSDHRKHDTSHDIPPEKRKILSPDESIIKQLKQLKKENALLKEMLLNALTLAGLKK